MKTKTLNGLIALLGISSLVNFSLEATEAKKDTKAPAAAARPMSIETVVVAPAVELTEAQSQKYVGTIAAIEKVNIHPRVTGIIQKVAFKKGEFVKKGDLLYEIEDTTYRASVASAEAKIAQIESELKYASKQLARNQELQKSHVVSESVLDDAERAVTSAKARLAEAEALLIDAKNNLTYTKIYSPIDGRIGQNSFTYGNLVTPTSGTMVNIEMVSPTQVRFAISEKIFRSKFGGLQNFKDLAKIKVQLADDSIFEEIGEVTAIDNKIDTATNTINIWATFKNENKELISGSFVTVLLARKNDKPLVGVLQSGMLFDNNGSFVYVVDNENKVSRRNIKLGSINGNYQEITDGLEVGENVVVDGTHKVRPGSIINPVPVK